MVVVVKKKGNDKGIISDSSGKEGDGDDGSCALDDDLH